MTDTEIARAQAALSAPVSVDADLLGAVRRGLLAVPAEPAPVEDRAPADAHQLAVRRRTPG